MRARRTAWRTTAAALCLCLLPRPATSYSVLTHEQLIDLTWKATLQPLLRKRFPGAGSAALDEAHSYAYGGSAIQDLGYYPFANEFFSDLTHYVRSGAFVTNLLRDARDVDEYAFALGALSHYAGDCIGHHDAVNPATAIAFPKLEKKYGPVVTYDEDPHAHVRVEFAFDIAQLAKQRFAPGAYLRFIGLRVPIRLLTQAFEDTYSLQLRDLLGPGRHAVRSYRASVRSFLPRIAHAENVIHRNQFGADVSDAALQQYLDEIARADFQSTWNRYRHEAGITTHLVAFLIRILPKVGVLSELAIKIPTADTEQLYVKSVNRAVEVYEADLKEMETEAAPVFPDRDLDTGEKNRPGAYALTDATYARLLHELAMHPGEPIGAGLKEDILAYYGDPSAPIRTKKNVKAWAQVQKDLGVLQGIPVREGSKGR